MARKKRFVYLGFIVCLIWACGDDTPGPGGGGTSTDEELTHIAYNPVAYDLQLPDRFPSMKIPMDNPLTVDGVELGRHLFYDVILSSDGTLSCASCHLPSGNFTDNLAVSPGVTGETGRRSAMSLLNVGLYNNGLFWDGRSATLEDQALLPVEDPIELHESWPNVVQKIQDHDEYPTMFRRAFGIEKTSEIDRDLVVKAIAQFERILVSSGKSKYDRVIAGEDVFSDEELDGFDMYFDLNPDLPDAECAHCHNAPLFTTNEYLNNGIDSVGSLEEYIDKGRGDVTGNLIDFGKFRVPTLRDVFLSAPYMHDGRFETIEEVIDHYNSGGFRADNVSSLIRPLGLTDEQKQALIAFLHTLDDPDFTDRPEISNPYN